MTIEISEYIPPTAPPAVSAPPEPARKDRSALYITLLGVATFLITLAALNWHVVTVEAHRLLARPSAPAAAQAHVLPPSRPAQHSRPLSSPAPRTRPATDTTTGKPAISPSGKPPANKLPPPLVQ